MNQKRSNFNLRILESQYSHNREEKYLQIYQNRKYLRIWYNYTPTQNAVVYHHCRVFFQVFSVLFPSPSAHLFRPAILHDASFRMQILVCTFRPAFWLFVQLFFRSGRIIYSFMQFLSLPFRPFILSASYFFVGVFIVSFIFSSGIFVNFFNIFFRVFFCPCMLLCRCFAFPF